MDMKKNIKMKINRYIEFLNEASKYKHWLAYSKKFKDMLDIIQSNAEEARENDIVSLIEHILDQQYSESDITLIDVGKSNDMITFVQSSRIINKFGEYNPDDNDLFNDVVSDSNPFWKEQRSEIRVGKFIRKLIADTNIKDATIEKFVNKWKAEYDEINAPFDDLFELVSGDDIKKWYLESNYLSIKGSLGNSCMRYSSCQDFFKIYTENKEVVSLLIMKDKTNKNKITGRALIWSLNNGEKYMDRIYTIKDHDENRFIKYSLENGLIYKTSGVIKKGVSRYTDDLYVNVKKMDYDKFPYMDTFICFNYLKSYLTNDDTWPENGVYKLQETDGSYQSDNVVFCRWSHSYVEKKESIYFKDKNDWVHKDDCPFVKSENKYYHPDDVDVKVFWSYIDGEYLSNDECHQSATLGCVIKKKESIKAIINEDGEIDYFPKDDKYYSEYKGKRYYISILLLDSDTRTYIPWFEEVTVFKTEKGYLTKEAADKIDVKIDKNDHKRMSYLDYYKTRNPYGSEAYKAEEKVNNIKISKLIDKIKHIMATTKPSDNEYENIHEEKIISRKEVDLAVKRLATYMVIHGTYLYVRYWNKLFHNIDGWTTKAGRNKEDAKIYDLSRAIQIDWNKSIFDAFTEINTEKDIAAANNYITLITKDDKSSPSWGWLNDEDED